ncbi:MAG: YfbM family protein [Treponema sp.]|nr:YfbM family protein [Treponema sp.]
MGMLGVYMGIEEEDLQKLINMENDDIIETLEELECDIYNIDKLWDGLHFLLTGNASSNSSENNKLSEAIVGIHNVSKDVDFITNIINNELPKIIKTQESVSIDKAEDMDYISYIQNNELPGIIKAMEDVNINELKETFEPLLFKKNKIYPKIWEENKKDILFDELIQEFNGLLNFYKQSFEKGLNIIFSIY